MRNVSEQLCRELKTHLLYSVTSPPPENNAVYEIMWKNTVEPDRSHMTIRHMRITSCITKASNTHSEYVILIAFTLRQCLSCSQTPPFYQLWIWDTKIHFYTITDKLYFFIVAAFVPRIYCTFYLLMNVFLISYCPQVFAISTRLILILTFC